MIRRMCGYTTPLDLKSTHLQHKFTQIFAKLKTKTDLLLSPFCRPMSEGLKRDLEKIPIIFNVAFFPRRFTEKYFQDSFYKNHECCYICMGLWLNG